ncbi:MAG TPA: hypothetical protein VIQ24_14810 [Pyrinomonadaceae bacterium]
MKSYRSALAAVVLTLAFSTNTFANAGVLWTEKTPPPPPPPNGAMWIGEASTTSEEDSLTEITLTLLQTLLPLL